MENLLEIKSLNTYYGESHILRDVDLNVKSGEMVCLIGRNGVGKTTLLKSLIGLLKQKKGDIYLIGENIKVRRFTRYTLGEGIEKNQMDFAEEVASMQSN